MKLIGLRTIKTAVSIFICVMIYILLKLFVKVSGANDFAFQWYNPFFAGIATAYSLYPSKRKSLEQAKNRAVASIIGGIVGILLVFFYELACGKNSWPSLQDSDPIKFILPYTLSAICSILVITIALALKQPNAIFVSILTLLSVAINPNRTIVENYGIWVFGFNRILSTLIGLIVALGVNMIALPHLNKNRDLFFTIGIDGLLKDDKETIKGFFNYQINKFYEKSINFTLFTTRAPMTFMHLLNDVKIKHPIICMSGAAIYSTKDKKYIYEEPIDLEISNKLDDLFSKNNIYPFKNRIEYDALYITVNNLDGYNKLYFDTKKDDAYCNINVLDYKDQILYYLIFSDENTINNIVKLINDNNIDVFYIISDCLDFDDANLKYLKIYSKNVSNLCGLKQYVKDKNYRLVGLTGSNLSNHLLMNSDIAVTFENNPYKNDDFVLLNKSTYNQMFKTIDKIYYSKKYKSN